MVDSWKLQEFIYSMNKLSVRNSIMNKSVQKEDKNLLYKWYGTVFLNDRMSPKMIQKKMSSKKFDVSKIILITYAYEYEQNKIHYVSVVCDMKAKQLIIFDPGYNTYIVGKTVLIPTIKNFFSTFSHKLIVLEKKACFGNKYGIQRRRFTRGIMTTDAFCQSWTLYFLQSYLQHYQDLSFFDDWCSIHPKYREPFLIQNFILPNIQNNKLLYPIYKDLGVSLEKYLINTIWN